MRRVKYALKKIEKVQSDVFRIVFSAPDLAKKASPGQFLHVKIGSAVILRRPFSIHKISGDEVSVLFRVRGKGTGELAKFKKGDLLDIIGPLGRGFSLDMAASCQRVYLVAGGIGVAPLLFLAQALAGTGSKKKPLRRYAFLGAKTAKEILCASEFAASGTEVMTITEDGSCGRKGLCLDLLDKELNKPEEKLLKTCVYACGPAAMFEALAIMLKRHKDVDCEVSYEQFMGCGIGICLGCAIQTRQGYKRVCKDGPVFNIKDVF